VSSQFDSWTGRLHLKGTMEGSEEVGRTEGSLEAAGLDATAGGMVLAEQVEGEAAQQGEIVGALANSYAGEVLTEGHAQDPVHAVLDAQWLRTASWTRRAAVRLVR